MRAVLTLLFFAVMIACGGPSDSTDDPRPPKGDDPTDAGEPARTLIERIEDWNVALSPSDRESQVCKMAASPFSFFRGVDELSGTIRELLRSKNSEL